MSALADLAARWPEINALLDEALELPPSQRAVWLEQLGADRGELRDTLRRLLDAPARVTTQDDLDTLPKLALLPTTAYALEPKAGDRIGPYQLVRELGQGGMGAVWLADRVDGQLKRHVALKLPRLAWGGNLIERLTRERDILASLEHPHIARLYDAGVDVHGRPYLAMEFVEGRTIDDHVHHNALDTRAVLALLQQVAAAVAHAHSRLVIHRDLKPANMLVTREGQVRLLDFGIAKLMEGDRTADTALTRTVGRALTLDYASPEQVRGEPLTTASDVYSLAVVAYELLAGQRPYTLSRGSAAELEEAIATAHAPLASERAPAPERRKALRGDLDAILNKALKKAPAERYATVDAMAQDIARHLAGNAVLARPDSLSYRLFRLVRRQRRSLLAAAVVAGALGLGVGAGAAALVITALLVGIGTTSWQARRAIKQAHRAQIEARTANAVQAFLEGVFRANSGDQADPVAARQRTAKDLLDEGAARIELELQDAPQARLRVLRILAQMYEDLDELDHAVRLHERRISTAVHSLGEASSEELHARAARAGALTYLQQLDDAQAELRRAQSVLSGRVEHTADARIAYFMASAACHKMLGQAEPGLVMVDQALALLGRQAPSPQRVVALFDRAGLLRMAGRMAEVVDSAQEALALIGAQPSLGGSAHATLNLELGAALQGLGDLAGAERALRQAVERADRHHGPKSDLALVTRYWMGQFLLETSRPREAAAILQEAMDRLLARQTTSTAMHVQVALLALAIVAFVRVGWIAAAEHLVHRGNAIGADRAQSPVHAARWLVAHAALAIECGDFETAAQALDRVQTHIDEHGLPSNEVHRLRFWPLRVHLQASRGEPALALQALRDWKAATGRTEVPAADDLTALETSAEALIAEGRAAQARQLCEQGLSYLAAHPRRASEGEAEAALLGLRGQACLMQNDPSAALDSLRQAEAMRRGLCDPEQAPTLALIQVHLGRALLAHGDRGAAMQMLQVARAAHGRHPRLGPQHTEALRALEALLR